MRRHFERELEQLKRDVLLMGGQAEAAVARAMRSFAERDASEAASVIDGDREIDAMELRIEEECLKILSLYGPAAKDLRYVVAVFKITNDLERVGDLAANIAERATQIKIDEPRTMDRELHQMAERVRVMLREALDAFLNSEPDAARDVLAMDDEVDDLLRTAYESQAEVVHADGKRFKPALRELSVAKNLERIADHATNVAEDVIYMVSGEVVKHAAVRES